MLAVVLGLTADVASEAASTPATVDPALLLATGLGAAAASSSAGGAAFGWVVFLSVWLFKVVFWLAMSLLAALWWFQGYLLYLPQFQGRSGERRALKYNAAGLRSPAEQQLPFEEHYIPTSDGVRVHTWLVTQQPDTVKARCPTIIFFHGNAGNIGFRLPAAKTLYYTTGCNILMVDYRGYGNSSGAPSEGGLKRDSQACLDFLLKRNDIDPRKIFVFGQSLGGGVATDLVARNQDTVRGLILENTFTSITDMVLAIAGKMGYSPAAASAAGGCVGRVPWESVIRNFLRFFMTSHWSNKALVGTIRTPILFISGLADELVPPQQMRELHDLATHSTYRQWVGIEGGEHNATYIQGAAQYFEGFSAFVSHVIS